MGALAPNFTQWIPEDDLALTKAVEAGASLESLAKGAVKFSQRFTIRELQNRWHSLLYDPVISAHASACMVELERNAPSKSIHVDNAKENVAGHRKRKVASVRTCYYAMRKRICTEPLNQDDFGFQVPSEDNCHVNGNNIPDPNAMLRSPPEFFCRFDDAGFGDLDNDFPEVMGNNCLPCGVVGSSQEFNGGQQNKLHDMSIEENSSPNNVTAARDCSGVGKMETSGKLSLHDLFVQAHDVKTSENADGNNHITSDIEGNQVFSSRVHDGEINLSHLHYPSPAILNWRHMGPISGAEPPGDPGICMEDQQAVDAFGNPHADGCRITFEYEAALSETEFGVQMPNEFNNTPNCNSYLAEFPNTVLDLARVEDMLFRGDDGKDTVDKIDFDGLSSLLLNSPIDGNVDVILDQMSGIIDAKEASQESYVDVPSGSCAGELGIDQNRCIGDRQVVATSVQIPSVSSTVNSQYPELCNGVICCTLNTEVPEIPCNDDIIFPPKPWLSTSRRKAVNEANLPTSSFPVISSNQPSIGICSPRRQPHVGSQIRGSDMRFNSTGHDNGAKNEVPGSEHLFRHPWTPGGGPGQNALVKKQAAEVVPAVQYGNKQSDRSALVSDSLLQNGCCVPIQGADVPSLIGNRELNAEALTTDGAFYEPVREPLLDPEEPFYESDTDVPYFSDIESMVLDMQLDPDDHDLHSNSRVANYQNEESKRAIIRLEQGLHSYTQRAIASHGAFAILYGRHSKHYIKKPEVLLGRATDHVLVDIDLGKEGRASKISRRQAIIKMEGDGWFHLKNLGKFSLSINGKEVCQGQSVRLESNCLIEIRGVTFIFDWDQVRVRQYLANAARKVQETGLIKGSDS